MNNQTVNVWMKYFYNVFPISAYGARFIWQVIKVTFLFAHANSVYICNWYLISSQACPQFFSSPEVHGLVVRKMDNAMQQINQHTVDSVICIVNSYSLDSILQTSNNRGQVFVKSAWRGEGMDIPANTVTGWPALRNTFEPLWRRKNLST